MEHGIAILEYLMISGDVHKKLSEKNQDSKNING